MAWPLPSPLLALPASQRRWPASSFYLDLPSPLPLGFVALLSVCLSVHLPFCCFECPPQAPTSCNGLAVELPPLGPACPLFLNHHAPRVSYRWLSRLCSLLPAQVPSSHHSLPFVGLMASGGITLRKLLGCGLDRAPRFPLPPPRASRHTSPRCHPARSCPCTWQLLHRLSSQAPRLPCVFWALAGCQSAHLASSLPFVWLSSWGRA